MKALVLMVCVRWVGMNGEKEMPTQIFVKQRPMKTEFPPTA